MSYENVKAEPLTADELEQLDPDSPAIAARRESIANNSANMVTVQLPYGVLASLIGPLIRHMVEGAHGVQQGEAIAAIMKISGPDSIEIEGGTPDDLKELIANMEDDKGIVRMARTALTALANADTGDRFFPVDVASTLEKIDADFPGYNVPLPQVLAELTPEKVYARIEKVDRKHRARIAEANNAVGDELAKFALDTDSKGRTLN